MKDILHPRRPVVIPSQQAAMALDPSAIVDAHGLTFRAYTQEVTPTTHCWQVSVWLQANTSTDELIRHHILDHDEDARLITLLGADKALNLVWGPQNIERPSREQVHQQAREALDALAMGLTHEAPTSLHQRKRQALCACVDTTCGFDVLSHGPRTAFLSRGDARDGIGSTDDRRGYRL